MSGSIKLADIGLGRISYYIFPTKSYFFYISLFFLSMIGLSFGYVMSLTTFSLTFAYQGIELLSYLFLIFSLTGLVKVNSELSYFRMIGIIYFVWQIIILFRGDYSDLDYFGFKQLLFDLNYGGIVLMIPLMCFINFNLFTIKRLFDAVVVAGIVFFVCVLLNLGVLSVSDIQDPVSLITAEMYFKYFALPIGLLAMNFNLLNTKVRVFVLVLILTMFVLAVFRARRGMLFMTTLISFFAILNYFLTSKRKFHFLFYIAFSLIGGFLILYYSIELNFSDMSFFRNISDRGMEDTRSYVENCFYQDMSAYDWILGKGYNGGYECSGIDDSIFKGGVRKVIETDYLQLILIGGIINLTLLFFVIVPAIILGLFYSNNNLVKTFSVWIFCWLIFLYPANVYSINLNHVSVWICAAVCYIKPLRMLPDSFVVKYFTSEFTYKSISNKEENV